MSLEIGRIDHGSLWLVPSGRTERHSSGEHTHRFPPFPAVMQCYGGAVFSGRIPPAQAVLVDEDNPAQDSPVITPGVYRGSWENMATGVPSARPSAHTNAPARPPREARIRSRASNQWVLSLGSARRRTFSTAKKCSTAKTNSRPPPCAPRRGRHGRNISSVFSQSSQLI